MESNCSQETGNKNVTLITEIKLKIIPNLSLVISANLPFKTKAFPEEIKVSGQVGQPPSKNFQ